MEAVLRRESVRAGGTFKPPFEELVLLLGIFFTAKEGDRLDFELDRVGVDTFLADIPGGVFTRVLGSGADGVVSSSTSTSPSLFSAAS